MNIIKTSLLAIVSLFCVWVILWKVPPIYTPHMSSVVHPAVTSVSLNAHSHPRPHPHPHLHPTSSTHASQESDKPDMDSLMAQAHRQHGRAARQLYQQAIELAPDKESRARIHLRIATSYREGSHEDAPDAPRAMHHYLKVASLGYEDGLLEVAALYMHGLHPYYAPDKVIAGRLYTVIGKDPRCSKLAHVIAQQHLREISAMRYGDLDAHLEPGRQYRSMPADAVEAITAATHQVSLFESLQQHEAHMTITTATPPRQDVDDDFLFDIDTVDIRLQEQLWDTLTQRQQPHPQTPAVVGDPQNVHSSSVQNAAAKKLQWIQHASASSARTPATYDNVQALKQRIDALQDMSEAEKRDARMVIDSLHDKVHSRYGQSELDVFKSVWGRIQDPVNADRQEDMIRVFAQNLASGVEHGHVVCSTGKIVRMIGSLDGMDQAAERADVPKLTPEWMVDREIADYAAKLRQDTLAALPSEKRDAYENGGDEAISQQMRDALKQKVVADYVQTGIMDSDVLEARMEPYLESL
jgi:TPR repeat protein